MTTITLEPTAKLSRNLSMMQNLQLFAHWKFHYIICIIFGILTVFIWRGVWVLTDLVLEKSYWIPSIISTAGFSVFFYFNSFINSNIIFKHIFIHLNVFFCIQIWRGIWYFQDEYFLKDSSYRSCYLSIGSGYVGLILLGGLQTALAPPYSIYSDIRKWEFPMEKFYFGKVGLHHTLRSGMSVATLSELDFCSEEQSKC